LLRCFYEEAAELLSEEQWKILELLFPEPKRRKDGRGRPWSPTASVWKAFCGFCIAEAVVGVRPAPSAGLGRSLSGRHYRHCQKGGSAGGKTCRGNGTKCIVPGHTCRSATCVSAVGRVPAESTIATVKVPRKGRGRPRSHLKRIIADRGYDSDAMRNRFRDRGTELLVELALWGHFVRGSSSQTVLHPRSFQRLICLFITCGVTCGLDCREQIPPALSSWCSRNQDRYSRLCICRPGTVYANRREFHCRFRGMRAQSDALF